MEHIPLNIVKRLLEEAVDEARIEVGRIRQEKVGLGQRPDYAPLLLGHTDRFVGDLLEDRTWKLAEHQLVGGVRVSELADYPHYTLAEQVNSPKKMLYEALWEMVSWARTKSDAQLTIRVNIVNVIPSCFGLMGRVTETGGIWWDQHLTLDKALDVDLHDLRTLGDVPRVLDHVAFFRENLPQGVKIYCSSACGPLTVAESVIGNTIWSEFYDNPDKIRQLLDKCTDACIELCKIYKEAIGEPLDIAYHGPLYLARGGIKVSDDNIVMLSPGMYREFVLPCIRKIFAQFSGGWFHSCGFYPAHLDLLCSVPEITAINFGNPEMWDLENAIRRIKAANKFYYGGWQRLPDESFRDYLYRGVRLLGPNRNSAILMMRGEVPWPDPNFTMDLWHKLQKEA